MTKNHKKMMEWVMRIAQSFNGDAFTSYCITARWSDHAPARYLPNTLAVSAILKRLESSGEIRKSGERSKTSRLYGATKTSTHYRVN